MLSPVVPSYLRIVVSFMPSSEAGDLPPSVQNLEDDEFHLVGPSLCPALY